MRTSTEPITLTLPPEVASELPTLSRQLNDRMHELLERNTNGELCPIERSELETLVYMAHFAQILALAVRTNGLSRFTTEKYRRNKRGMVSMVKDFGFDFRLVLG